MMFRMVCAFRIVGGCPAVGQPPSCLAFVYWCCWMPAATSQSRRS